MKISVVICAHNPRPDYLKRVLFALKAQRFPLHRWELLLIDNASEAPVCADLSWHPNARIVHEPQLGLAYARERGINEAACETIMFVDDDNVLSDNYLDEAAEIGRLFPELGTWGSGDITAEFETPPSPDLDPIIGYVGITGKLERALWSSTVPYKPAMPIGAGICIRKRVALSYCRQMAESAIKLTGRNGSTLLGCDDYEMSYTACALGFKMGVFPELKLTHLINSRRVTESYLLALVESTQVSELLLRYKWFGILPRNPNSLLGRCDRIFGHIRYRGIERRKYAALRRAAGIARKIISASGQQNIPPVKRIGTEEEIEAMTRTLQFQPAATPQNAGYTLPDHSSPCTLSFRR